MGRVRHDADPDPGGQEPSGAQDTAQEASSTSAGKVAALMQSPTHSPSAHSPPAHPQTQPSTHARRPSGLGQAAVPGSPRVLGGIDSVSPSGLIAGWAWRQDGQERCHVRIIRDGEVIAETLADAFRADLLRAGMGLGHCGFYARLRVPLPPGAQVLTLVEARLGVAIGSPLTTEVPRRLGQPPLASPLLVLTPRPTWRDEDVLENLAQFDFAGQCEAMGFSRFVDVVFRFALGRWPESDSREAYVAALRSAEITPDAFVQEVLLSAERKGMTTPLPSPFDYRFPFHTPSLME